MNIIETNLSFKNMDKRSKTERIILHHSGVSVLQSVEVIHNYHKNTQKYAGIGYHFYVRKDGSIHRGRPEQYVGAHAYSANSNSIGICAEGDFNNEVMSEAQKNALIELVSYLKEKYKIGTVQRHSDTIATSCPGKNYPFDEIVDGKVVEIKEETVDNQKEKIKELQRLLNKVYGFNLAIDGIIGVNTNAALRKFALSNYCANELVLFIQERLEEKGFTVGSNGKDGKYGKDTANAVSIFQKAKGLKVDGIAGINTIKALV